MKQAASLLIWSRRPCMSSLVFTYLLLISYDACHDCITSILSCVFVVTVYDKCRYILIFARCPLFLHSSKVKSTLVVVTRRGWYVFVYLCICFHHADRSHFLTTYVKKNMFFSTTECHVGLSDTMRKRSYPKSS